MLLPEPKFYPPIPGGVTPVPARVALFDKERGWRPESFYVTPGASPFAQTVRAGAFDPPEYLDAAGDTGLVEAVAGTDYRSVGWPAPPAWRLLWTGSQWVVTLAAVASDGTSRSGTWLGGTNPAAPAGFYARSGPSPTAPAQVQILGTAPTAVFRYPDLLLAPPALTIL